jgi:hypothetical protein
LHFRVYIVYDVFPLKASQESYVHELPLLSNTAEVSGCFPGLVAPVQRFPA